MKIINVPIDKIVVGERKRALNSAKVDAIAESIKANGGTMHHPISVYVDGEGVHLVTGYHRLEAAKKLGWRVIRAEQVTAANRGLWELDENLARADLSPEEERDHHIRRQELWQKQRDEAEAEVEAQNNGASCATNRGRGRPKGYAAETAVVTGKSKSQINRILASKKPKPKPRRSQVEKERELFIKFLHQIGDGWETIHEPSDAVLDGLTKDQNASGIEALEAGEARLARTRNRMQERRQRMDHAQGAQLAQSR